MNNKRRFFVAGACLAAVLICAPVQTVYAQPEGVTTEDAAKTKKMEAPAQITLENLGFGQLQISWTAVEGASEYRIYRSATETGGYKKIADVTDTVYTDTVTTGATHYYKVVAMRLNEKGKRVRGTVSAAQMIEVPSDIPQVTAVGGGTNGMTVQWSSVDGAQEYAVYRSTQKGKGYKKVTTTALTSYTDIGTEPGSRYYYKVAAGRLVDDVMKYQAKSPAKSGWTAPSAPTGLTAAQAEGGIDLKWTAPKGATYYRVYRAVGSSTSYTLLADKVKKTSYTDAGISAGEKYSYYVVAARGTSIGGKSTSAAVSIGQIKVNTRTLFLGPGVSATLKEQSALPGKIGFVSENPAVATVNADGKVTGVAAGKTQIQVTVGVVSTSVTVTVTDCPVNGIDVSKWQQDIDWKTVKASGIKFAMLRLAHGSSKDIQFENFYSGATEQGIPVGIYCYSTAKSVAEGKKEAQSLLEMLDNKELTYPIALDLEDNAQLKNMNKDQRTKLILEYKKVVEDAGYDFIVYANLNWLTNYIDQKKLEENDVDIWIARYCSQSLGHRYTGGGTVQMWQYSSTGQIDGILDAYGRYINVDLDVCYGEY